LFLSLFNSYIDLHLKVLINFFIIFFFFSFIIIIIIIIIIIGISISISISSIISIIIIITIIIVIVIVLLLPIIYTINLPVVRPRSCRVIYYFDTPTLGKRHQYFGRVKIFGAIAGEVNSCTNYSIYFIFFFHCLCI